MSKDRIGDLVRWSRRTARTERAPTVKLGKGPRFSYRRTSTPSGGGAGIVQRRAIVRGSYVDARYIARNGGTTVQANRSAHTRYMQREGVGPDAERGELFSDAGREPPTEDRAAEERYFRLVLSPEDGDKLDLKDYTRRVMTRVRSEMGKSVEWYAAAHYNTERPHVHIVIRGDSLGERQMIDGEFMRSGFRRIAQEEATRELGERTQDEIRRQRERETTQDRYTTLDRSIESRVLEQDGNRLVTPSSTLEKRRLEYAENIGLASASGVPDTWNLSPDYGKRLKLIGTFRDIDTSIRHHVRDPGARDKPVYILSKRAHIGAQSKEIPGTVLFRDAHDDDSRRDPKPFAVIETKDALYYYDKDASALQKGDNVLIENGKPHVVHGQRDISDRASSTATTVDTRSPRTPQRSTGGMER